jgi:uroporphyrinogen decarboxylase
MTKREIVKKALNGQPVPYTPWSFRFTVEAAEKLTNYYGTVDLMTSVDNHFIELGSDIGFYEDIGDNRFKDIFGVIWDRTIDKDIGNVEGDLLPGPTLDGYTFPDPLDPRFFEDITAKLEKYSDRFRLFCLGFSLYERAWAMRGMENFLMDFYTNPDFVHELLTAITDYNIKQVKKALDYDIDAVYFGDDWGQQHGVIMGYALWKEFIYPQLKRMYGFVRDHGKYVFIHSCGDVDELFDDLIDIGLNCFNPFQPEVMDTNALYNQYKGKLAFWGGLSTQKTMPFGSVENVHAETSHLIDMGQNGSYILSPAHALEGDVPLENMLAMIAAVKNQPGYISS